MLFICKQNDELRYILNSVVLIIFDKMKNCSLLLPAGVSPKFVSLFSKKPPPITPDKCDPDMFFDAVTDLPFSSPDISLGSGYWTKTSLKMRSFCAFSDLCGANIQGLTEQELR